MLQDLSSTSAPTVSSISLDYVNLIARLKPFLPSADTVRPPKIAVIGDYCLDKYIYLYPQLNEISVETGLIARQVRAKKLFAGVGGTITSNLRALGAETYCFGAIGEDGEGFDLLNALRKIGAHTEGIVVSPEILTCAYVKPMTPETSETDSTILQRPESGKWIEGERIDTRNPNPIPSNVLEELKRRILKQIAQFDAVVISDQFQIGSQAVFSDDFRNFLGEIAKENPNVFFLCDSRFYALDYSNMLVKCNSSELLDAYNSALNGVQCRETTLGTNSDSMLSDLCLAGKWLADRKKKHVLVTRGASGSLLVKYGVNSVDFVSIPSNPVEPPIDICGAGDATNAGFVFAKSIGFSLEEAAYLAGVVSSITIKQIGVTGTASVGQVIDVLTQKLR